MKIKESLNHSGFTLLAIVVAVMVLAVLGTGVAVFVSSNQVISIADIQSKRSFYAIQAGIEFAEYQLRNGNQSMSTLIGAGPNAGIYEFAGSTFKLMNGSGNVVTILGAEGNASSQFGVNIPKPADLTQAGCLFVDTTSAYRLDSAIRNIRLIRNGTCTQNVVINSMKATWTPNAGQRMIRVDIDNLPIEYSSGTGVVSGVIANFGNPFTISDSATHTINNIIWNTTIPDGVYTFDLTMGDASVATFQVNFLASNQANCLTINQTGAYLGDDGSGIKTNQLMGMTLSNTCLKNILIDKMTVSWTPLSPTRNLTQIALAGAPVYSGTTASGIQINITDTIVAANSSLALSDLRFDSSMMNQEYTIVFTMQDATSKSSVYTPASACLAINVSGAKYGGTNNRDLIGLKISNTCDKSITLSFIQPTWSGAARTMIGMSISGNSVWSGVSTSGTLVDITDYTIAANTNNVAIDYMRFSGNMNNRTFSSIMFRLSDNTEKSVFNLAP